LEIVDLHRQQQFRRTMVFAKSQVVANGLDGQLI